MGQKGTFGGQVRPYEADRRVAIKSWQTAWSTAKEAAGVERWHDLRRGFVWRMAEGQATDTAITALLEGSRAVSSRWRLGFDETSF
jgi:integrase